MHNTQGATPAPSTDTFEITEAGRDAVELHEALVESVRMIKAWRSVALGPEVNDQTWDRYLQDDAAMQSIRDALLTHCVHAWPVQPSQIFDGAKG